MKLQQHSRRFGCLACALLALAITIPVWGQDDDSTDPVGIVPEQVRMALLERFDENWNQKLDTSEVNAAKHRLTSILDETDLTEIVASDWRDDLQPVFDSLDTDHDAVLHSDEISEAREILEQILSEADTATDAADDELDRRKADPKPHRSIRPSRRSTRGLRGGPAGFGSAFGFSPFLGGGNYGDWDGASAGDGWEGNSLESESWEGYTWEDGSEGGESEGFESEAGDEVDEGWDDETSDSEGDDEAGEEESESGEDVEDAQDAEDNEFSQDDGNERIEDGEDGQGDDLSEAVDDLDDEEGDADHASDDDANQDEEEEEGGRTRVHTEDQPNF